MQFRKIENSLGRYDLLIDTTGLNLPCGDQFKDYQTISIKSYTKVSSKKSDCWDLNFGVVNGFMDASSVHDREQVAMCLIMMHYDIVKFMKTESLEKIPEFLKTLSQRLLVLDQAINLCPNLVEFCRTTLPFCDQSGAGKRAQDTDRLTFKAEDVVQLTGIAALCKLMSPIFGALMYYLKDQRGIEAKSKELHCVAILHDVLDYRFHDLIDKLKFYIRHSISKDFVESMTTIYNGITLNTLQQQLYAALLVRNFANVDLYRKNSNLMVYVKVSVRIATTRSTGANTVVMLRGNRDFLNEDDSKKSQLEFDSIVSGKPADTTAIIKSSLDLVINNLLHEYDIDWDSYEACLRFYHSHPVHVHELNRFLLQKFMGPHIGGPKSLGYLHATDMSKVIALTQSICFVIGYRELGHALSARESMSVKSSQTEHDIHVRVNYKSSAEYKLFRNSLEQSIINPRQLLKRFDQMVLEMVDKMTTNVFYYNTAPVLWDVMGAENLNGSPIQFTHNMMQSTFSFVELVSSPT